MTSNPPDILNLIELIEPNLEKYSKILSYKTRYLTKPGDNYGSIMLGVTAEIQNSNGKIVNLELVAKIPPTNKFFWAIFQPERSCRTENSIYLSVKPTLIEYQKRKNIPANDIIDLYANCYGARISLNTNLNADVDRNALLVLDNLVLDGYKVLPREIGFDHETTLLLLKNLACFHGLPIAFRLDYPKEFDEKIFKNLKRFDINKNFEEDEFNKLIEGVIDALKTLKDCISDEDIEKARKLIKLNEEYMANPNECEHSLWTTIAHYDFWINNVMIKCDENDKPINVKILDFQISQYESLAHDVIFFLLTSVQDIGKYEEYLQYYYNELIKCLHNVNIPTNEYSYQKFLNEINRVAPIQFCHILFMLRVIFVRQDSLPDEFDDMSIDSMNQEDSVDENYYNQIRKFIKLYKNYGYM